jgi:hypothetical protein
LFYLDSPENGLPAIPSAELRRAALPAAAVVDRQ